MLTIAERAAEIMTHLCNDNRHGYSIPNRAGVGTGGAQIEPVTLSDGAVVMIANGDRDCSSAVIECYASQGIDCGGAYSTSDMRECMINSGNFRWEPMGNGYIAQPGDIYLAEGHHAAMCTCADPDELGEFATSESGTTTGARGDQTGSEAKIHAYYNYPWDGKLVYVGNNNSAISDVCNSDSISLEEIAQDVINGKYGNYPERKTNLEAAGYDYDAVQKIVNKLLQ